MLEEEYDDICEGLVLKIKKSPCDKEQTYIAKFVRGMTRNKHI